MSTKMNHNPLLKSKINAG